MRLLSLLVSCALALSVGCGDGDAGGGTGGANAICEQAARRDANEAAGGGVDRSLDPPTLANTVQVRTASGVELDDGVVITNWHVCTFDRRILTYNAPLTDGEPYREGDPFDGCVGDSTAHVTPPDIPCPRNGPLKVSVQLDNDPAHNLPFGSPSVTYQPVFAQKAIDLCILHRLPDNQQPPPPNIPVMIETAPVHLGQAVVVGGHPRGCNARVVEHCHVVRETTLVRDPDHVNPSDTEVMSFGIDCKTVQHGSSGSPVLDATTGALLGLAWTSECEQLGACDGIVYVSAASAWRSSQGERPIEQYSRLDELLDRFGGP